MITHRNLENYGSATWEASMSNATIAARVERIALKLRTAARGKFQPFGADSHSFQRKRPLTERQVAAFEQRFGVKLPAEYRAFITRVANGDAGPGYGMYSLAETVTKGLCGPAPDDFLRTPFAHTDASNPEEDEDDEDEEEQRALYLTAGTLVLCTEGCGILHLLVVKGRARGQMWVDDRCNGQGLFPLGVRFLDWYEKWLDSTLAGGDGLWWHGDFEE
jgi:hypothetical protein